MVAINPAPRVDDDAIFNLDFERRALALLATLPDDTDLVYWGWNFDSVLWFDMIPGVSRCIASFNQETLRKGIDAFQSSNLRPRAYGLFQAFGNVCYSISSVGARLLRQNCLPLRNTTVHVAGLRTPVLNYCIDVALNGVYSHMNCFVCIPPLVVTRNDHSLSTVQR